MNSASQQAKAYAVITEKKTLLHLQSIATKLRLHVQSISITEFAMQQVLEEVADTQSAAILFDGLILMIVDKGNIHMVRRLNGATDEDVGDEFTLEMERSLDFYQSEIHNALPEKLYLTPQKAKIKGLTALLQEKMLMPIEVIDVSKLFPGALRENQDISNCVACIGEALRVIKMGVVQSTRGGL